MLIEFVLYRIKRISTFLGIFDSTTTPQPHKRLFTASEYLDNFSMPTLGYIMRMDV